MDGVGAVLGENVPEHRNPRGATSTVSMRRRLHWGTCRTLTHTRVENTQTPFAVPSASQFGSPSWHLTCEPAPSDADTSKATQQSFGIGFAASRTAQAEP